MKVEVLVRVDVIQRQPGVGERLELGADLRLELAAHGRQREEANTVPHHVVAEPALGVDQRRDASLWQHRPAVGEHEVQTDREIRQLPCAPDGVGDRWRPHHQTGSGQHTLCGSLSHGPVDRRVQPEVVRGDD